MFDLSQIRVKLDALRSHDPDFFVFGAYRHQYRLGDPISESSLVRIETKLQVGLPEEFRQFLLQIGNGGAGPGLGLERLDLGPPAVAEVLARTENAFAYRDTFESMYWKTARLLSIDSTLLARECKLHGTLHMSEVSGSSDDEWFGNVWMKYNDGMLPLADLGGGMVAKLMVSGEKRGTIWIVDESEGESFVEFRDASDIACGEVDSTKEYKFVDWYEHWLDQSYRKDL